MGGWGKAICQKTDQCSGEEGFWLNDSAPGAAEPDSGSGLSGEAGAKRVSLWIVDDDPAFLETASALLAQSRREILTFTSPGAALGQLECRAPDLAVLDLVLPEVNGFECARRIRAYSPQTAILIVTGLPGSLEEYPEYHAQAYEILLKPFLPHELCQRVDLALRGRPALATRSTATISSRREALIRERKLDAREVAALDGLSKHKAYKEIAAEQNWSKPTTAKIIRRAFSKLGVRRREEAVEIWKEQTK